jgi:hypothetical protein
MDHSLKMALWNSRNIFLVYFLIIYKLYLYNKDCEIICIYIIENNGNASPENYIERVYNWPASSKHSTFEPISDSLARIY